MMVQELEHVLVIRFAHSVVHGVGGVLHGEGGLVFGGAGVIQVLHHGQGDELVRRAVDEQDWQMGLGNGLERVHVLQEDPGVFPHEQTGPQQHGLWVTDRIDEAVSVLDGAVKTLDGMEDYVAAADFTRDEIISKMAELRSGCDEAETLTAAEYWPFPTYGDLLFGV